MTYAVQQDLVDRFGTTELAQLTDRTNGTVIDATVLGRALSDADAEIDGYLAARYQLPLATAPAALVRIAADLARYRLYDDRVTEAVRNRYQDAVTFLKGVSSGSIVIDGAAPLAVAASAMPVKATTADKVFSADVLGLY